MFCRPCFNRFWGLKYIPRRALKTFDVMRPHQGFIYMLLTLKLLKLFRKPVVLLCDILMLCLFVMVQPWNTGVC
jgi:hypothetical protein